MKKTLLFFIFTCFISVLSAQTLKINEVSICNISKNLDPNYDYSNWIEIYNEGSTSMDLRDFYFSDSATIVKRYKLSSSRIIPPGGFGLVWVNDEIKDGLGGYLDTDNDGGFLSIADLNGNVLDKFYYRKQYTNVSYGRTVDGGSDWGYFIQSSCGKSNNGSLTSDFVVPTPIFSLEGGFYDSPQTVEIYSTNQSSKIYYTLNASEPDSSSYLYNGTPIEIAKTTTLRAKAFATGTLEGTIATATYLMNERKPDLPVVFLTTDTVNLYNDTIGIYCVGTNGIKITSAGDIGNYNQNWTRAAYFEFLDKDKNLCLSQGIGLSISGNFSRTYNQKSFEIKAKGKFGESRFDYPFFKDKVNRRFKTLTLRNGGQQTINGFLIKDALNQSLVDVLNIDYQGYEPCVVYLNGEYWGIMPFREKSNKQYIYSNYNYDETEFDLIDQANPIVGNKNKEDSLKLFVAENNLTNDSIYNILSQKIDIENYCYYMATEIFLINTDWPTSNMRRFCPKADNGKFRWILQDLDKGFSYFSRDMFKHVLEINSNVLPVYLLSSLLVNEKFKELFVNTQCLVAGSVYGTDRVLARIDKFSEAVSAENVYNAERWDEDWVSSLDKGVSSMKSNISTLKSKCFNNMQLNLGLAIPFNLDITSSEPSTALFFNGLEIPVLPYDGMYFMDKALKLEAPAFANGRKFKNWEITVNDSIMFVDSLSFTLRLAADTKVNAMYIEADSVRRCGLYINEVSANNDIYVDEKFKHEDWIELYNSSDKPIALNNYFITNNTDIPFFQFTEMADTIPAFGYGIVWCSDNIYRGGMHTNFKLEKDGGRIVLAQQSDEGVLAIVDSITYKSHTKRTSFGRSPDGSNQLYVFDQPSFKSHNLTSTYNVPVYYQENGLVSEVSVPSVGNANNTSVNLINNQLVVTNNEIGAMKVSIYNISGILYEDMTLKNSTEYRVNVSNLPQGVYLVYVKSKYSGHVYKVLKR